MQKSLQLELFKTQSQERNSQKRRESERDFFAFIKLHEKAVSIAILVLITSIISFSLGVEKGKHIATIKKQDRVNPIVSDNQPAINLHAQNKTVEKSNKIVVSEKKKRTKYTIQVATFKTKTYAQREAERLKRKGLEALIIPVGKFMCVCVGNFSKKQEAKLALIRLKEIYQDCFIRRL